MYSLINFINLHNGSSVAYKYFFFFSNLAQFYFHFYGDVCVCVQVCFYLVNFLYRIYLHRTLHTMYELTNRQVELFQLNLSCDCIICVVRYACMRANVTHICMCECCSKSKIEIGLQHVSVYHVANKCDPHTSCVHVFICLFMFIYNHWPGPNTFIFIRLFSKCRCQIATM